MRVIIVSLLALTLAGCVSSPPPQLVTKTEAMVIVPEKQMFHCPSVKDYPNPDTLTDMEVAKLLIRMNTNNKQCQKNMDAIYDYLLKSKATIEKKN
jgi:hypothetical protein